MLKDTWLGVRLLVLGALVVVLMVMFFSAGLDHRLSNESYSTSQLSLTLRSSSPGQQVGLLRATAYGLVGSWFGAPPVYQPPAIAGTDIQYFDVKGTTQDDLIASLDGADICQKYGPCAVDPSNPGTTAWGLQWETSVSSSFNCATPATTTVIYTEHILLPRWKPPPMGGVEISVVERWNALLKSIYVHEAGHVAISVQDIRALNDQARRLPSCTAVYAFWNDPHIFDKLDADQLAYHARLRADCRPEIGCIPAGWMGW